ncbi:S1C family serine protease [Amycolatopsis sp. CA-230715]|uniref:S1C family serine protease n=1 Tax=Amycolatopsis sp. CA-230715 TaxID=2745196 RepID=UPI001C00D1CF|nr:trypsin-like peptidase domain-containing protein [Amycolatopsis sp. CA-230715]QWF78572.1 hypothetical protein HUW46_01968 [Amycolatopsis sp. CA-230715]
MTENDFRPGPAGGYQQPTPPLFTTPPPKKKLALIVGSAALAAALVGGVTGAAVAGLGTSANAATTVSAQPAAAQGTDATSAAAKVLPSVVQVTTRTSQGELLGSGVIISSDGRIITNAHVVAGAEGTVTVTLSDGKQYRATVLGSDTKADIAVLQAQGASGLTAAQLGDSSTVRVGQEVLAIGSPGGLQNTVTEGIVSATNRRLSDFAQQRTDPRARQTSDESSAAPSYTAIQTDAAINHGNSGGALVDTAGQVIGINSALYNPEQSEDAGNIGIGFAIPVNDAKAIADRITG